MRRRVRSRTTCGAGLTDSRSCARPVSKLEHAARWCKRRPAFASLLAVLAFTVSSSIVGLLTLWRHSEAERTLRRECPGPCHQERHRDVRRGPRSRWLAVDDRGCTANARDGTISKKLRKRYAISPQSCAGIQHSPHPTSSRSVNSNVNWRKISGVVVTMRKHVRCSWTVWTYWKGEELTHVTKVSASRMHGP